MGLRINQNIAALNAARNLRKTDSAMSKSLERLSSGFRVNRAADDPAGLIISENLRAQISGLGQAVKNAQNAVNLISTAEAALDEVLTQLRSIRTLALDALNTGASDSVAIAADQTQIASSISTLTRVGNNSQFGKIKLLDGSAGISGSSNDVSKLTFVKGGAKTASGTYDVTNLTAATKGASTFNINNEFQSADGVANGDFKLATNGKVMFSVDFADGLNAADSAALGADLKAAGLADDTSQSGIIVRFNEGDATAYVTVDQAAGGFTADTFDGATSVKDALNKTVLNNVITFNEDNTATDEIRITGKIAGLNFKAFDATVQTTQGAGFTAASSAVEGSAAMTTIASGETMSFTVDFGDGLTTAGKAALGQALADAGLANTSNETSAGNGTYDVSLNTTTAVVTVSYDAQTGNTTQANVVTDLGNSTSNLSDFVTFGAATGITAASGLRAVFNDGGGDQSSKFVAASDITAPTSAFVGTEVDDLGDGLDSSGVAAGADAIKVLQETLTFNGDKVVNIVNGTAVTNLANSIQQQLTALGVAQTVSFTKDTDNATSTDSDLVFTNDNFGSRSADGGRTTISSNRTTTLTSSLQIGTTNVDVEGTDVVGQINSKSATGVGQVLTLDSPGDNADGVSVKFTGTTGDAGLKVSVTAGTLQFQVGANSGQVVSQGLPDVRANKLGLTATGLKTSATSVNDIDVTTADGASDALLLVDAAIAEITTIRGELGAFQSNVLEATISSLGAAQENLAAAESSIRDADFAEETVTFTRNQILLQAGTSILTQANAIPQAVLQLLQ